MANELVFSEKVTIENLIIYFVKNVNRELNELEIRTFQNIDRKLALGGATFMDKDNPNSIVNKNYNKGSFLVSWEKEKKVTKDPLFS